MAIRKTYGIEAAAKAGKLIGEIQAGEKEQARKERLADKAAAYANQRAMAKFNAQMQFERFKMSAIMDLQSEQRARAWEVEKMQRRSELDFAADERQRAKRIQEFQSGISEIEKAEQLNQYPQYVLDQAKSDLASKYYDIPQAAPYLGLNEYLKLSPSERILQQALSPQQTQSTQAPEEGYEGEEVYMRGKDGKTYAIPIEYMQEAIDKEGMTPLSSSPKFNPFLPGGAAKTNINPPTGFGMFAGNSPAGQRFKENPFINQFRK